MTKRGIALGEVPDDDLRKLVGGMGNMFRDNAPLTAADAAKIILDGVRAGEWRILVGEDAKRLDEAVRRDPLSAYGTDGLGLGSIFGGG
jgi:hypothetical protein